MAFNVFLNISYGMCENNKMILSWTETKKSNLGLGLATAVAHEQTTLMTFLNNLYCYDFSKLG